MGDVEMFADVMNEQLFHGWREFPGAYDENQIKQKWPKTKDEYPKGYSAADPPGFCRKTCSCMEDWHMGDGDSARPWLADKQRDAQAKETLNTFSGMGEKNFLIRRGSQSGMHHLQPMEDKTVPPREMQDVCHALWNSLGKFAQKVPLP